MSAGYKVRLEDGSEIGPLDIEMLRSWYENGLIGNECPVLKSGARSWTRLGDTVHVQDWGTQGRVGSPPGRVSSTAAGHEPRAIARSAEAGGSQRWRTIVSGILFFFGAALAGFWTFFPERRIVELAAAPWREIILGQLLFALILIRGWELGRKLVRVAVLLVAFALLPFTGLLLARGLRGNALLALLSAWVLAVGFFVFLWDASASKAKVALGLITVLAGWAGVVRFGLVRETKASQEIREWASYARRFTDEQHGIALDVPSSWLILREDSPLISPPAWAGLPLAQPRMGALARLRVESAPRGVVSPDHYLDRLLEERRKTLPSLKELTRSDVSVRGMTGRRAVSSWEANGNRFRDLATVWKDGWTYIALVAWLPEPIPADTEEQLALVLKGFSTNGVLAAHLRNAIQTATQEAPHVSATAAQLLMEQSSVHVLEPEETFRRAQEAASRGLLSLPPVEAEEMVRLNAEVSERISKNDRPRLAAYLERARNSLATLPAENGEMSRVMKEAFMRLDPAKRSRLQALYERAISSAIRNQPSPAS